MARIGKFLKDNGLSLAFWALFVVCLLGEALSYYHLSLADPRAEPHLSSVFAAFGSGQFLRGVLGNWQAALLQLFALIAFAVFLRQRGASHSRKPEGEEAPEQRRDRGPLRRGGSWLYRNSLSLAFLALFLLSFAAFFAVDLSVYNGERAKLSEGRLDAVQFFASPRWWFDLFQTWQAEFFAMGVFLVLTIFLRQENSAESKPVWAPDDQTGETNE